MTTHYGVSHRALPAPVNHPTLHAIVSALPSPDAPTPRRRRNIICRFLTLANPTMTADDLLTALAPLRSNTSTLTTSPYTFRCTLRRGVDLMPAFVADRCASSFCRGCEWAAEQGKAA